MKDTRTASMLQRLPVILAVTAASYGLALPANSRPAKAATSTQQPAKQQPTPAAHRR